MSKAIDIVLFSDSLEGTEKHYGILFENGSILCFCCGGYIDPEDYIIIKRCDWNKVDETLLKNESFLDRKRIIELKDDEYEVIDEKTT